MKFIEVKKVTEKKKRINDGSDVINPQSGKKITNGELESLVEAIEIDTIKSWRKWVKTAAQNSYIEGDMTVIYFKNQTNDNDRPNAQMLIEENSTDFTRRMPAIPLIESE